MGGFLGSLLAGVGAGLSNTEKARTSTATGTSSFSRTEIPQTSPEFQGVSGALSSNIIQGLNQPIQFRGVQQGIDQFEQAGLQEVNSLSERIARQIENNNRARGLSFSGAAGFGEAVAGQARTGALSNLLAQIAKLRTNAALKIPQIRADIQSSRIRGANQFLGVQPIGVTIEGGEEVDREFVRGGSALGSALSAFGGQSSQQGFDFSNLFG